jgi:signal transduction histidine kinase
MSPTTNAGPRLSDDRLRRLAAYAVAVGVLGAIGSVVLHAAAAAREPDVPAYAWASVVFGTAWPAAGFLVVRAQPRNRVGWLLLATAWISVYQLLGEYSIWNHYVSDLPLSALSDWTSMWGFAVYLLVMPLVPLLFPDGRLPSPRWRWLAWSVVIGAGALAVARMFVPGGTDVDLAITNPIDVPWLHVLNYVVAAGAIWCNAIGLGGGVLALVLRTRRSVGVERAQLQWLALGGVVLFGCLSFSAVGPDGPFTIGLLAPPLAIAVSVVRHRLFDVDLVLNRTLVLLAVTAAVTAVGAWVLLRLDPEVAGTRTGVLLVAGLAVAVVLSRAVVQAWVDRLWFPHREDAALLGRRIADTLSDAAEPREALRELVGAVRSTLRLPYVGFAGAAVEVATGERPEHVVAIDAVALGREVGRLEVAPRREGAGFTAQERQVLEETAAQAAMLAYAAHLVTDVERSRASIVRAREEERRRLRNDLHDGVGPSLAAIALQADVLATRLAASEGADGTGEQAVLIRDRLRETVRDVRAVSHGLRPPILDQIGLSAALRQLVAGLEPISGDAQVDDLDGLAAATEVATYAIASEAVANVVRHSAASRLRLDAAREDGHVRLAVADNGRGMPAHPRAGVGLTSMRERAVEVGGTLEHHQAPGGGTVVVLTVPAT